VLKALVQWLKDRNWPGTGPAGTFLRSVGLRTLPLVRAVLQTNDEEWIYNIVECLIVKYPREAQVEFVPFLKRLINEPIGVSWEAELDVTAAEILCNGKLLPQDELKTLVARVIRNNPQLDAEDIAEVEALVRPV